MDFLKVAGQPAGRPLAVRFKSSGKFDSRTSGTSMQIPSMPRFGLILSLLLFLFWKEPGWPQCAGLASTPRAASDCAAHEIPAGKISALDPTHPYSLAELVDIAEHNNPRTRLAPQPNWRRHAIASWGYSSRSLSCGLSSISSGRFAP